MNKNVIYIDGGIHSDKRGHITFVNDFDVSPVVRMYNIIHNDTETVRAWQGHQKETKFFRCVQGSFIVAWKKIDDFNNPSVEPKAEYKILKANAPGVLIIPPGYANGMKAAEINSQLLVMSDLHLEESLDDNIRFDQELWLDWKNLKV